MKAEKAIKAETTKQSWWLMSADSLPLGRLATEVATLLRGKHKPDFVPHEDRGDFVVIVNAGKLCLTGQKWRDKKYYSHSGFFGSLKQKKAEELSGALLIKKAVSGMLPKNKMRQKLMKKLKVYETAEHPHQAQKPSAYTKPQLMRKFKGEQT